MAMRVHDLEVILEPDLEAGGFVVTCPSLPGCYSQGETEAEAMANIKEAIELCLEIQEEVEQETHLERRKKLAEAVKSEPGGLLQQRQVNLAKAARALLKDYQTDEELTAFSVLDGTSGS